MPPFLDLVYPPQCQHCHERLYRFLPKALCPTCVAAIKVNHPPFCLKCSRHLSTPVMHPLCHNCLTHEPYFDFAWAATLYEEPMKKLLHRFKYSKKTVLRIPFGNLINSFIDTNNLDIHQFDIILPIPLFASRLRERGFNQALLLAQGLASAYNLTLDQKILYRSRPTQPQSSLDKKKRWTNVEGAFRINQPRRVKNKTILLVDDLLTSGATASQAAKALKKSGARSVGVLTLSITI